MMPKGLTDKLYWRWPDPRRPAHCFKRIRQVDSPHNCRYRSLCGEHELYRVGGQQCRRPPAIERCSMCDVAEMKRRGWEESGPDSPNSV